MNFPDTITVRRKGTTAPSYDSESGMPVSVSTARTVYSGEAFVQDDESVHAVTDTGDVRRASDAKVFLPAGTHDIELEDSLSVDDRSEVGRVVYVSRFKARFYTRVDVRWQR